MRSDGQAHLDRTDAPARTSRRRRRESWGRLSQPLRREPLTSSRRNIYIHLEHAAAHDNLLRGHKDCTIDSEGSANEDEGAAAHCRIVPKHLKLNVAEVLLVTVYMKLYAADAVH